MQQHNVLPPSQSLWVRDRFLIEMHDAFSVWQESQSLWVRDRFLINKKAVILDGIESQSLWVRDRFLIRPRTRSAARRVVAIPLGQGQVFNR